MNSYLKLMLFLSTLFIAFSSSAQPSSATIKQLRKSTVKVTSGSKTSTGFIWNSPNLVVTTLHSIEDTSTRIKITSAENIGYASVVKILKKYDLALLKLEKSSNLPALSNSSSNLEVNKNLYVLGYNGKGNLSNIIDRSLRLGYNHNGKLKGLLSSSLQAELNACKSPDPEIDILYFDGSLLPGFSGSPIVDSTGKLVGIADGGLENGAQSISWGISSKKLTALLNSKETIKKITCSASANKVRFASEDIQDDTSLRYVEYQGQQFIKTKTRTIRDMQYTIDDPLGLEQLINTFALSNNLDYLSFSYDIYVDAESGATLCVPEGMQLQNIEGILGATFPDSSMAYISWSTQVAGNSTNINRFQQASEQFDQLLISTTGNVVHQPDPEFSYEAPMYYENGLVVNRKAFRGYVADYYGNSVPQTYLYETHIGFKNTYLGIAVVHYAATQEILQLLNDCVFTGQCIGNSEFQDCAIICENYKQYSQLALGVHMSGFSNVIYRDN